MMTLNKAILFICALTVITNGESTISGLDSCTACGVVSKDSAPLFFHPQRKDGVGSTLQQMIYGMAYAHTMGWNYGGVIGEIDRRPHGFSTARAAKWLFGTSSMFIGERVNVEAGEVYHEISIRDIRNETPLLKSIKSGIIELTWYTSIPLEEMIVNNAAVSLSSQNTGNSTTSTPNCTSYEQMIEVDNTTDHNSPWVECNLYLDHFLKKEFLVSLRAQNQKALRRPSYFPPIEQREKDIPIVAMHVRRGDVSVKNSMYTSSSYYLQVMHEIQLQYPNAIFHVFTSSQNRNEFDVLIMKGVKMHFNGDPLLDWEHMAQADVLVMAKSTFSFVPALLNQKCVVYQHHWRAPLSNWITSSQIHTALESCLCSQTQEREEKTESFQHSRKEHIGDSNNEL